MIRTVIAISAAAGIVCPPAVLYASSIGAGMSVAAETSPEPPQSRSAPATGITTFAPIFPTPTEDQPQPWSEDDGPLHVAEPTPTTRVVDPTPNRPTTAPRPPQTPPPSSSPSATAAPPADVPRDIPTTRPPDPEPTPQQPVTHPVTALVNNARADAGCPPVTDDPDMTAYAQQWAQQQAADQLMRHSGGPYAENVAAGYPTGAEVMTAWMGSSGHRGNIESCEFTRHGIGSAVGDDGLTYWTQVFGT